MRPSAARDAAGLRDRGHRAPSAAASRSNDAGRIVTLLPGASPHRRFVFIGAHVFAPALALEAPAAFSDIVRDLYEPRLATRSAHRGADDERALARRRHAGRATSTPCWIGRRVEDPARDPERAVVEAGAAIDAGASVRRSVVLGGARVGQVEPARSRGDRSGSRDRAASSLENVLVTPRSWGLAAASREDGPLVYTPLEPAAAGARMSTTQTLYLLLVVAVALERSVELAITRRNLAWAREQGAREHGRDHYAWMVVVHASFLIACPAEVIALDRPFVPLLGRADARPARRRDGAALLGDRHARPALDDADRGRSRACRW